MTENNIAERNRKNGFKPGQSGNPGGRPKGEREVVELARQAAPDAIAKLIELVGNADPRTAMAAANSVLDRAFGKPTQTLAGDPEKPLNANHSIDPSSLPEAVLKALAGLRLPTE